MLCARSLRRAICSGNRVGAAPVSSAPVAGPAQKIPLKVFTNVRTYYKPPMRIRSNFQVPTTPLFLGTNYGKYPPQSEKRTKREGHPTIREDEDDGELKHQLSLLYSCKRFEGKDFQSQLKAVS
ncbi:hypothetical protein Taro_000235 [Colocasia esculenta]|uniref:Uncharacterized protein n=1 Tax=Colocasia esculenta TaxID=4460 RepID=A0A843TEL3_COLES|nr:hypothetical protein [Colocasia esculenta]